jgi:hypothetical protein
VIVHPPEEEKLELAQKDDIINSRKMPFNSLFVNFYSRKIGELNHGG